MTPRQRQKPLWLSLLMFPLLIGSVLFSQSGCSQRFFQTSPKKIRLFITIDVETPSMTESWHGFDKPVFISGETLPENPGVLKIMDLLEERGMKGNFFVNVYEYVRHKDPEAFIHWVKEIARRGHAVELHSHPNPALSFYNQDLFHYGVADQEKILKYGQSLIASWVHTPPVAYRGGGYAVNDDTMTALHAVGIRYDSSMFFGHPNNHWGTPFTVNHIKEYKHVIEFPVTVAYNRNSRHRPITKLDMDWMGNRDLDAVIAQAKDHHVGALVLMMHSFSLIQFDRKTEAGRNKPLQPDTKKIRKFARFLDKVKQDPDIEVSLFRNLSSADLEEIQGAEEFIPALN